ncbi:aromatic/alkene monooxygenase hydroxylase subunit beta [Pseudomonas sp. MYb185]|uniref:aromatic/alkene monooxygenase hydroxylase subunit beta n=1 Tax=Pseudomonas sp. MYb185 TaxID=1848729 RepID=UPI000CFDA8C3|nr:aromatic/alkene monooxygenase hydroxylase subunit beta [Pseudomonas sp. MYb185]PRB75027.1 phenol hydroxylase [Pseudomonas sp. MYb185]
MSIEIKTNSVEPIRQTFSHIRRRFGDKPASRYQEASFDLEATTNFHYRPLWQPDKLLNDPARTCLHMDDWYAVVDPRQFYYGTYVQTRARMQETTEHEYSFCEKRGLLASLSERQRETILQVLVPLRHAELGANMNNSGIAADAFGTTVTQLHIFHAMDRLGIAQYLSRIGLLLDGGTGESLDAARQLWQDAPEWQGLRRLVEDSLVIKDWFELTLVQNLISDGLLYPLIYQKFDETLSAEGAGAVGMLTEFMRSWFAETSRWVDALVKTVAAERAENRAQIETWVEHWQGRVIEALAPLAQISAGQDALAEVQEQFAARLKKLGLFNQ